MKLIPLTIPSNGLIRSLRRKCENVSIRVRLSPSDTLIIEREGGTIAFGLDHSESDCSENRAIVIDILKYYVAI